MSGFASAGVWDFADAWLLTAALQFGSQGCSLSEVIEAADALNHDIPRPEQASRAIGRLIATALIKSDERRFKATPEGMRIYKRRARPMFEQASSVLRLLEGVDLIEGDWALEAGEFDATYEEYCQRVSRWTRKR